MTIAIEGRPVAVIPPIHADESLMETLDVLARRTARNGARPGDDHTTAGWAATAAGTPEALAAHRASTDVHNAVVEEVQIALVDARIRAQACQAVLAVPMLTSAAISEAIAVPGVDPEHVAGALRRDGVLLGVPDTLSLRSWVFGSYVYPAFQVNLAAGRVRPVVAAVNAALGAARDPWGVASWWVSPNGRLEEDQAPMDLVGTDGEERLFVIAGALRSSADSGGRAPLPR